MRAASRRLQGLKLEEAEDPYGDSGEEESKEESRDTDTEQDGEQDSDQFSREQAKALLKKLTKEMGSKKKAVKFASKYLGLHAYMCLEAAFSVNDRVAPNSADDGGYFAQGKRRGRGNSMFFVPAPRPPASET